MKRTLFLCALILIALGIPRAGFALVDGYTSDASTSESSCRAETYSCSCVGANTSTVSESAEATGSVGACDSFCQDVNAESYTYTCTLTDGTAGHQVAQGNVGSSQTTTSAQPDTGSAAPDFAKPNLIVPIPGFAEFSEPILTARGSVVSVNFLAEYISAVYKWVIGAGALVAVVLMMIGGLQYVLSRGKEKYITKAKARITNAITGLVLILAAYNITFLIDPRLTDLSALNVEYVPYIFVSTENTETDIAALSLPDPTGGTNGVPYFSQRNYTEIYGNSCSGSPTIKTSGCGPTSAAMVLRYYGLAVDPVNVAASFEASGYRICGSGTAYAAFNNASIIKDNGFAAKNIPISQENTIEQYLRENKPIIISVGPSKFTSGGHFMVLTGIDSQGNFMLNDPNSGYKTATKDEIYDAIKFATYLYKK